MPTISVGRHPVRAARQAIRTWRLRRKIRKKINETMGHRDRLNTTIRALRKRPYPNPALSQKIAEHMVDSRLWEAQLMRLRFKERALWPRTLTRLDHYMQKEDFVPRFGIWHNPRFSGNNRPRLQSNRSYVASSLSNLPRGEKKSFMRQLEQIGDLLDSFGIVSIVPHRDTDVEKMAHVRARVVKQVDLEKVQHAGFVVADLSHASTGAGQELRAAEENGIPVIMAIKRGTFISRMPIGIDNLAKVFEYSDSQELLDKLHVALAEWLGKPSELKHRSAQRQRKNERANEFKDW